MPINNPLDTQNIEVGAITVTDDFILTGDAIVESHVVIGAGQMKFVGGSEGQSDTFHYLNFRNDQDDEAYFTTRVPYRRVTDGNLTVMLRWYYTGGNDNNSCEWNLTYHAAAAGDDPTSAGTALTEITTAIATDDTIGVTEFTIPGNVLEADDSLGIKLWRDGSDALTADARLIDVHIHFLKDKLGKAT